MDNESLVTYAGFGARFVALLLDGVVFLAVFSLLNLVFPVSLPAFTSSCPSMSYMMEAVGDFLVPLFLRSFLGLVIVAGYSIVLVGKYGATVGKMALGLQVVREDGTPVSYGTAVVREFLVKCLLYGIIFYIAWLGYLWAAWSRRKQAWHDKIAGTVVVKI